MILPFQSEIAEQNLYELQKASGKERIKEMLGACVLTHDFDKGTQKDDDELLLMTEYISWVSACLFDALLNETDYQASFGDNETLYTVFLDVVAKIRNASATKNPLKHVSEFMMNMALATSVKALERLLDETKNSLLVKEIKQNGQYHEWRTEIIKLRNRLNIHVQETYMDYVNQKTQ